MRRGLRGGPIESRHHLPGFPPAQRDAHEHARPQLQREALLNRFRQQIAHIDQERAVRSCRDGCWVCCPARRCHYRMVFASRVPSPAQPILPQNRTNQAAVEASFWDSREIWRFNARLGGSPPRAGLGTLELE